jgi:excisionase family DNA binding protein
LVDSGVTERARVLPGGFISVTQAMELLGTCRATVYSLCARGVLGHRRVRNVIWIPAEEVRALLEARANDPKKGWGAP